MQKIQVLWIIERDFNLIYFKLERSGFNYTNI